MLEKETKLRCFDLNSIFCVIYRKFKRFLNIKRSFLTGNSFKVLLCSDRSSLYVFIRVILNYKIFAFFQLAYYFAGHIFNLGTYSLLNIFSICIAFSWKRLSNYVSRNFNMWRFQKYWFLSLLKISLDVVLPKVRTNFVTQQEFSFYLQCFFFNEFY